MAWQLLVGAVTVVLLAPVARMVGRRLERRLGSGQVVTGRAKETVAGELAEV